MTGLMCFIVPAFNESASIGSVVTDLLSLYPSSSVLVIDDNSSDETSKVAIKFGAKVIRLSNNLGIGGAVQTGLIFARDMNYEIAVQFDGDGQHLASEVSCLINPILDLSADYVVGSRWIVDKGFKSSKSRRVGIRLLSILLSKKIDQRLTDVTSGFRAMNKKTIELFSNEYSKDFPEIDAIMTAKNHSIVIKEVPVQMKERAHGASSISKISSIYYMTLALARIGATRGPL